MQDQQESESENELKDEFNNKPKIKLKNEL